MLDAEAPPYLGSGTLDTLPPLEDEMLYRPVDARGGAWLGLSLLFGGKPDPDAVLERGLVRASLASPFVPDRRRVLEPLDRREFCRLRGGGAAGSSMSSGAAPTLDAFASRWACAAAAAAVTRASSLMASSCRL